MLKGALTFHPSDADFTERWFVSFGSDYPLNIVETQYIGFEIQTALYTESLGSIRRYTWPLHGFLTAKYKFPTASYRPFVGAGVGLASFSTFFNGSRDWTPRAALKLTGGVELASVAFEVQALRMLESGFAFEYSFLFGVVW